MGFKRHVPDLVHILDIPGRTDAVTNMTDIPDTYMDVDHSEECEHDTEFFIDGSNSAKVRGIMQGNTI